MSESLHEQLISKLSAIEPSLGGAEAAPARPYASNEEEEGAAVVPDGADDAVLDQLLRRVQQANTQEKERPAETNAEDDGVYYPREPESLAETRLNDSEVEALILKYLLAVGESTGRVISEQVRLPFIMIHEMMAQLKHDQFVAIKSSAQMNDYVYQVAERGREKARRLVDLCTYYGAAPVHLDDYIASVAAQTIADQRPSEGDLLRAFEDLLINSKMLNRLGPAINSGRGLFLYGFPGNGKTSIAERITLAFGEAIWIPRAIGVDGAIIRVYDPMNHEEMPLAASDGLLSQHKVDQRWIRIRRPTIVAGGELTMNNLEVSLSVESGICEAPLQLKSNCGTLVIDDFGRQRMSTDELLNRWIVPLEKRYDFLNLPNGKKIQVPFDQLIVFSTNLEPKDLVDDAFLRRIPYKIEVTDPSEAEFRELFNIMAPIVGVKYDQASIEHLIATHYRAVDRPFRCCQPRDLLLQVKNYCKYREIDAVMSSEMMDFACENYFAVM